VKTIEATQQWRYPFSVAAEVSSILTLQLSVFLRYLLDRKRGARLDPISEFRGESTRAIQLAAEKPRFWEHLLTEELVRTKLARVTRRYEELQRGLVFRPARVITGQEFQRWIRGKLIDLRSIVDWIKTTMEEEFQTAWGPPGKPGDALEILEASNKLLGGCEALLNWEIDALNTYPPESLEKVRDAMRGSTAELIAALNPITEGIGHAVRAAQSGAQVREVVNVTFAFSRSDLIVKAFEDLRDHSDWHT
jgi:hypothetical protein